MCNNLKKYKRSNKHINLIDLKKELYRKFEVLSPPEALNKGIEAKRIVFCEGYELKNNSSISSSAISKKLGLNNKVLESGLNFLVNADNSITKDEKGNYQLTTIGEKRLYSDQATAMSLGAVGAYHTLLTNYSAMLKNKITYGKDFIRDGRLVAISSVLTGRANYSWVAQKFNDLKVDTVVDLGCGSGDIIIDFCNKHKSFNGINSIFRIQQLK